MVAITPRKMHQSRAIISLPSGYAAGEFSSSHRGRAVQCRRRHANRNPLWTDLSMCYPTMAPPQHDPVKGRRRNWGRDNLHQLKDTRKQKQQKTLTGAPAFPGKITWRKQVSAKALRSSSEF